MSDRVIAGVVAVIAGAPIGVFIGRLVWVLANPLDTCSLGPGGHCPTRPSFLPYRLWADDSFGTAPALVDS